MAVVALVQEFNYLFHFRQLSIDSYDASMASVEHPYLALGPQSYGIQRVMIGFTSIFSARNNTDFVNGPRTPAPRKPFQIDKWLVLRFSLACLLFCAFNIYLVMYSSKSYHLVMERRLLPGPDFSVKAAIFDWETLVPLVLPCLAGFFLFGTTMAAREHYKAMWRRVFPPRQVSISGQSVSNDNELLGGLNIVMAAGDLEKGDLKAFHIQSLVLPEPVRLSWHTGQGQYQGEVQK
ncbi:hypothetical protein ANO11243_003950 [Dothideomycetidae sp. 11243]|nr:hypothetical protein ANO11243_003950 [fungal sp. No.11243]